MTFEHEFSSQTSHEHILFSGVCFAFLSHCYLTSEFSKTCWNVLWSRVWKLFSAPRAHFAKVNLQCHLQSWGFVLVFTDGWKKTKWFLIVVGKHTQEKDMLRKAGIFMTWNWNNVSNKIILKGTQQNSSRRKLFLGKKKGGGRAGDTQGIINASCHR